MAARFNLPSGQVTFLFTDIEGSTRLARMLGEGYRPMLAAHRRIMRAIFLRCDGVEMLTEGDSFFVAFADAAAALTACGEAQRALAGHEWPTRAARPRVRMGLHTGYAVPFAGEYATYEVHRAARVAAAAHGGQVVCTEATAIQVGGLGDGLGLRDLGLHRLRGFDDRQRLYQLAAPGLEQQFPPLRTLDATPHNLPAPRTTFVGRVPEQLDLRDLLAGNRLVTVVGAPGGGKTRLAVATAAQLVDGYPDGVWFADLASATAGALIATQVAAAFGLRPEPGRPVIDTLLEHAAHRRCLLLLDTCDQQRAVIAPLVTRLLAGCPELTVLATSREPLGLPGEAVWRLPPLALEPAGPGSPSDAVALLLDRAATARAGEPAPPGELPHLENVARRLGGLPLALELAAARLRILSAGQLADRLDDVVGTLDAGATDEDGAGVDRHATMHAAVSWSYRTLAARPARLLRMLATFAGPVDLTAIEEICAEDPLDPLAVLVDKSLVQAEHTAVGTAYRMLSPIRAYAERRLVAAGEEADARDRHAAWCLRSAGRVTRSADGRPVTLSIYALDPLAAELRAALRWCATGGSARTGLRVAAALDQWWRERGLAREGREWLFRLYQRRSLADEDVPDAELAGTYLIHARHASADGEYAEEARFAELAAEAARRTGDPRVLAPVLAGRAVALLDIGRIAEAESACRSAIALAAECGSRPEALLAVYALAEVLVRRGDLDEAAGLLASARPLETARPAERGRRTVDMLLGMVALARGDLVAAHEHLQVALRSRLAYGFTARAMETVNAVAVRCALDGDHELGALLFGAAETERGRLRWSAGPWAPYWAEQQATVRRVLGDGAFDARYAAGAAMPFADAATLALSVEHPDLSVGSRRFDDDRFAEAPERPGGAPRDGDRRLGGAA